MEIIETEQRVTTHVTPQQQEEVFKPTGAIVFFILLVLLALIIWFGIYLLMIKRA